MYVPSSTRRQPRYNSAPVMIDAPRRRLHSDTRYAEHGHPVAFTPAHPHAVPLRRHETRTRLSNVGYRPQVDAQGSSFEPQTVAYTPYQFSPSGHYQALPPSGFQIPATDPYRAYRSRNRSSRIIINNASHHPGPHDIYNDGLSSEDASSSEEGDSRGFNFKFPFQSFDKNAGICVDSNSNPVPDSKEKRNALLPESVASQNFKQQSYQVLRSFFGSSTSNLSDSTAELEIVQDLRAIPSKANPSLRWMCVVCISRIKSCADEHN